MKNSISLYTDVETMTRVMPRIEVLYYFVYELAQCFHADETALNDIKKGILDNQILKEINIGYFNEKEEKIAEISIIIDWDKHLLLAKTDDGKDIEIDMSMSVVDNIVGWRKYAVAHIDTVMKQFDAYKVKTIYYYRNTISEDKAVYEQAHEIMNHVTITEPIPSAMDAELQKELSSAFEQSIGGNKVSGNIKERTLGGGKIGEVSVIMRYKVNE